MITVDVDWTPLSRYLDDMRRRQLPYVTAASTTKLAQLAQADVRSSLGSRFTMRSQWISKGIRIVRAEKKDWPAVQAIVGTLDWFMLPQETGAKRVPEGSRQHLPVPASGIRPTKETKIPRSKFPKALLSGGRSKRRAFIRKLPGGVHAGQIAVLRRTGTGRYPVQVLYLLESETKGKKRLGMQATVTATVRSNHARIFNEVMERALQPKAPRVS